jgi:hypothetical protein
MKSNLARLFVLFVLLSVTPAVSIAMASSVVEQNSNSSTTAQIETMSSPKNARCRIRCRKAFGACTRRPGDVRRRCLIQYRNCLRRCAR